jgi:hypothetical protein
LAGGGPFREQALAGGSSRRPVSSDRDSGWTSWSTRSLTTPRCGPFRTPLSGPTNSCSTRASPTTVKADDEQVERCVWPYCSDYGETSIRKGHVVAEVNWSGGRAWVHAYHLEQLGVRFARQRMIVAVSTRSMPRLSGGDSDERRRFCVSALGGHLRLSWCSSRGRGINSCAGRKAAARSVRSFDWLPTTIACSSAGPASGDRTSLS